MERSVDMTMTKAKKKSYPILPRPTSAFRTVNVRKKKGGKSLKKNSAFPDIME